MIGAGEPDLPDLSDLTEDVETPTWAASIALAGVILVVVAVGIVALLDGGGPAAAGRERSNPAPAPASTASTTVAPSSTTTAPQPTTTVEPTTAPPTTAPTATVAPSTVAPAPPAVGAEDGFAAAFPSPPTRSTVVTPGGAVRSEYDVDGPDGSVLSVTAMLTDLAGAAPVDFLAAVARRIGAEVGSIAELGPPTTVDGRPAQPLRARTAEGQVRSMVIVAGGRLFTVSMFTPGTGPTAAPDAVFDQLVASFRVL